MVTRAVAEYMRRSGASRPGIGRPWLSTRDLQPSRKEERGKHSQAREERREPERLIESALDGRDQRSMKGVEVAEGQAFPKRVRLHTPP